MTFQLILEKLIPFYLIILLGFISGKYLQVKKESIAPILIYILLPLAVFYNISQNPLSNSDLYFFLYAFLSCIFVMIILLILGKFIFKDESEKIYAVGIANGNFGFLGIPLTILLLPDLLTKTIIYNIAGAIFISTIGLYVILSSKFSLKESFLKILKMPIVYSAILGIIISQLGLKIPVTFQPIFDNSLTAYSFLGLMLIGIALSQTQRAHFKLNAILFSIFGAFLLWPLLAFIFINLDKSIFHLFDSSTHSLIMLMSSVPVGASIVAFASEVKKNAEEASIIVFVTTVISLFFIPLIVTIFF